ncbi:hypothetical protein HY091_01985 [Candidatus Kaiserbacteria bacterium]|nr:hypothetical protein [Candidatus Kaiserbacteria bacterium]
MSVIVPAILPGSKAELDATLTRLASVEGVDTVQVDAVDGRFAAPASWPYGGRERELAALASSGAMLPYAGRFLFDIDLMALHPEATIGPWVAAGASRLTLHAESSDVLPQIIRQLREQYGRDRGFVPALLSLGLAIGVEADASLIEPHLTHLDYVQFMGIAKIGKQGEPFDPRVVGKVRAFHRRHPHIPIQVDGGVTKATAPALLAAGASRLIVGSGLLKSHNIQKEFDALVALAAVYGIYEKS